MSFPLESKENLCYFKTDYSGFVDEESLNQHWCLEKNQLLIK